MERYKLKRRNVSLLFRAVNLNRAPLREQKKRNAKEHQVH
jgi:hypothetical protein